MKKQHLLFLSEETEMDLETEEFFYGNGITDDDVEERYHPYQDTQGFAAFF